VDAELLCWMVVVEDLLKEEEGVALSVFDDLFEEDAVVPAALPEPEAPLFEAEASSSPNCSFRGAFAPYSSDASFRGAAAPPLAFMPGKAVEGQCRDSANLGSLPYHRLPQALALGQHAWCAGE
jgi:hypothetical protein